MAHQSHAAGGTHRQFGPSDLQGIAFSDTTPSFTLPHPRYERFACLEDYGELESIKYRHEITATGELVPFEMVEPPEPYEPKKMLEEDDDDAEWGFGQDYEAEPQNVSEDSRDRDAGAESDSMDMSLESTSTDKAVEAPGTSLETNPAFKGVSGPLPLQRRLHILNQKLHVAGKEMAQYANDDRFMDEATLDARKAKRIDLQRQIDFLSRERQWVVGRQRGISAEEQERMKKLRNEKRSHAKQLRKAQKEFSEEARARKDQETRTQGPDWKEGQQELTQAQQWKKEREDFSKQFIR